MIRRVLLTDAAPICEIYNYYIINTVITFEEESVNNREIEKRIAQVTQHFPWLVFEDNNRLLGYAYATQWRTRSAYRYSAESTVYVKQEERGKGIGLKLYEALIKEATKLNLHSLIGGIALPNDHSIALHEKLGFKKVAHFQQVGYKLNQWIDVGYWQYIFANT